MDPGSMTQISPMSRYSSVIQGASQWLFIEWDHLMISLFFSRVFDGFDFGETIWSSGSKVKSGAYKDYP